MWTHRLLLCSCCTFLKFREAQPCQALPNTHYCMLHTYTHTHNHTRTARGHVNIVRMLLASGGDASADNNYALKMASAAGHLDVVKLVVQHGADVCTQNYCAARMALMHA
jgi:hypothetical protein